MANLCILSQVKDALGITGDFQDDTLNIFIGEVMAYMIDAGVPEEIVGSDQSVGVISRGVIDLWRFGDGGGNFSSYFYQRVAQLKYKGSDGCE